MLGCWAIVLATTEEIVKKSKSKSSSTVPASGVELDQLDIVPLQSHIE